MTALIAYLMIALLVSFLCSIMEAVLLSTPQSFLMPKLEQGKKWAGKFIGLKKNIDRPLSAILSLNTVAHTVGAAGVGAQSITVFGDAYFGIVSAVLTILILVLTEIIPKTIGAQYWRGLASFSSHVINGMILMTYPVVIMSAAVTRFIAGKSKERSTSREEISALASIGSDEGIFSESEHKIIQNLLRLKNVKVTEIMTPRIVTEIADGNLPLEVFLKSKDYLRFSRIPIYDVNRENITGYVFRQEVFEKLAEGRQELKLKDIKRDIIFLPDTIVLYEAWEHLLDRREHIAVIMDEYGGIEGIVTMEDIIETLLGLEIVDEKDVISDMQKYARDRWKTKQAKYRLLDELNRETDDGGISRS